MVKTGRIQIELKHLSMLKRKIEGTKKGKSNFKVNFSFSIEPNTTLFNSRIHKSTSGSGISSSF